MALLTDALRRHPLRALFALALLLGFAFQGTRGLWEPDEGRYTNVALQMLHSGDFVSLRRNDEALHFTKPPLTYWTIAASVATFGRNEWAVRLPIALAYALTVLVAYRLGRRFVPGKPWLPALIYASSPVPLIAANWINTDTMLAAMEALAVACFVRARFEEGAGARWLDAMWAMFGLAFLTKGPPALLPLAAIALFSATERQLLRTLWRPLGLLGFAVLGLGWFAVVVQRHPGLLDYFLGHEVYARIATAEHKRFPEWYGPLVVYLPTFVFGSLPWLALYLRRHWRTLAAGASRWRGWSAEKRFLLCWLLLPLLVFCLARSRLPTYVLPSFLPLALLLGRGLATMPWNARAAGWLAAWLLALLGFKYYLAAGYPTDKDGRQFAEGLSRILPGHPEHLMFVDDMARNGLNLYFDSDIRRLSFEPEPKAISDSSYDLTVAQALARPERGRVFVMKREGEARFLAVAAQAGKQPLLLGALPESHAKLAWRDGALVYLVRTTPNRRVYTLAGDFPVPGPIRRD